MTRTPTLRVGRMDPAQLSYDLVLPDPGLVANSADAEHCVHACFQMLYRTRAGAGVPSFAALDRAFGKRPGRYTYEFRLLPTMCADFDVEVVWGLDLHALAVDPRTELLRHFGEALGQVYVANTDLGLLAEHAATVLRSDVAVHPRPADVSDVVAYLTQGYYLTATINQRVLQADPGYVAHSILIYGCSARGVRIHNPGPPATARSEIPWDLFMRAWTDGAPRAANLIAVRPRPRRTEPDPWGALSLALRPADAPHQPDTLDQKLASSLADRYGLEVHRLELVCRRVNLTFRVVAEDGVFYLRLYQEGRSPTEISLELRALAGFPATDVVSVAKPRWRLRTGGPFFRITCGEQRRHAALFEEAPGEQPEATLESLCRFAGALAALQRAMGQGPRARPFAPAGIIRTALESLDELGGDFEPLRQRVQLIGRDVLAELSRARLASGFCHGDAWLGNVRFHGGLTTFFDFNDCHRGPLIADVARLLRAVWDDHQVAFLGLARCILEVYGKVSGIEPREFRSIPALARLGEIATMGFLARHCTLSPARWAYARDVCAQRLDDWAPAGKATSALKLAIEGLGPSPPADRTTHPIAPGKNR